MKNQVLKIQTINYTFSKENKIKVKQEKDKKKRNFLVRMMVGLGLLLSLSVMTTELYSYHSKVMNPTVAQVTRAPAPNSTDGGK